METTTRYVVVNVEKALALSWPVWFLLPTRALLTAAQNKVMRAHQPQLLNHPTSLQSLAALPGTGLPGAGVGRVRFLLVDQLPQALRDCFPAFPGGE
ncbi:MAG: hypothetical protein IT445_10120 [Phycisphaeraceae bacterium]|nr:hypothetical protein [Phycisphaeraceae bacterium]